MAGHSHFDQNGDQQLSLAEWTAFYDQCEVKPSFNAATQMLHDHLHKNGVSAREAYDAVNEDRNDGLDWKEMVMLVDVKEKPDVQGVGGDAKAILSGVGGSSGSNSERTDL